jgi:hypothetical protein
VSARLRRKDTALRLSFATTNAIESIQAHFGRLTAYLDRYHNSEQRQRWVGPALLEIEPRLRRVRRMRGIFAPRAHPAVWSLSFVAWPATVVAVPASRRH